MPPIVKAVLKGKALSQPRGPYREWPQMTNCWNRGRSHLSYLQFILLVLEISYSKVKFTLSRVTDILVNLYLSPPCGAISAIKIPIPSTRTPLAPRRQWMGTHKSI